MPSRPAWTIAAVAGSVALLIGFLQPIVEPPAVTAQAPPKYTGLASCSGSNCHSQSPPKSDFPKLDENTQWRKKDKHAKAFDSLRREKDEKGQKVKYSPSKIAQQLKIDKPEASERCLTCHAVNVPAERRGPRFYITDAVHCDGCHGPAEVWLNPHAKPETWSHAQSVKAGMYDTKDLLLRAEKCVSCHLRIDAEMVAAGHPDLVDFELDNFSYRMPAHWGDRGAWFGPRAWATGQVVALKEAAFQLETQAKANAAPAVLAETLQKLRGHAAVVRHVFAVLLPEALKPLEQEMAAFTAVFGTSDPKTGRLRELEPVTRARPEISAASSRLVDLAKRQAPRIAGRELDQATTGRLIQAVAGDAAGLTGAGIRGAQQGYRALDALYIAYSKAPGSKVDTKRSGEALDRIEKALADPATYDPNAFSAGLRAFQQGFPK